MQDVPLTAAIENLGRQAGVNYILDPKLANLNVGLDGGPAAPASVSIRWEILSARQALTRLLREYGLRAIKSPVSSVTRITFTNQAPNIVDKARLPGDTNAIIPLMQMQEVPLDKALNELAKAARFDVSLHPSLTNPVSSPMVSFRWEKLTPQQAIAAVCENYDLVLAVNPTTGDIRISPKKKSSK